MNEPPVFKEIPFLEQFHEPIRHYQKIMTCRTKPYGRERDILQVKGTKIVLSLLGVFEIKLGLVERFFYEAEGCSFPEEFVRIWRRLHNNQYDPDMKVWAHVFEHLGG